MMRKSEITRTTRETDITVALELDGTGKSSIDTGIPFMNHMLELFAKHGFFDLEVRAKGDIEVDYHHTMEDLGLVLGQALAEALGDKAGIRRYGSCILPMDETLALVALDLSGRPCLVWDVDFPAQMIRDLDVRLFCEFFQALVNRAGMNLHVKKLAGEEVHHVAEAIFKAFAKALDQAVSLDPRVKGVLSTKGSL
ncbi:imidazoleglycerol-phosphate dehydratase HisB [uncultured Victivallis sp.]|uniref:imidazoleglycerol-phosphate dehydratase HisB n=1 Tax=uncultured Victivallis sp. TaxID=354118 RepID=UPI00345D7DE2